MAQGSWRMGEWRSLMRYLSLFLLLSISCVSAAAQSAAATGAISGTVTDASGAAIPGATIIVKNTDFASVRSLTSDDAGAFAATFLPAGAYTVEVKATGFQSKRPVRVTLGAGSSVRVDVRMALP